MLMISSNFMTCFQHTEVRLTKNMNLLYTSHTVSIVLNKTKSVANFTDFLQIIHNKLEKCKILKNLKQKHVFFHL